MKLEKFVKSVDLLKLAEIEKVKHLAYYFAINEKIEQFGISDIIQWFEKLSLSRPNISRLTSNLKKSRAFIKGSVSGAYRLHATEIAEFNSKFKFDIQESEDVLTSNTVIPETLYIKTRGYIESLSKQINASFENNIFDGCAVLMRRLLEILLVLAYQNNAIEDKITNKDGSNKTLADIIKESKVNKTLKLSKETKEILDTFRQVGNFSAHKIYYNTKKGDLKPILLKYRVMVEELLYKSGIKT